MELSERHKKVNRLFRIGYADFKDGLPLPENRIKAMGWRLARKEKLDYECALEQAYEAFAELDKADQYLED